MQERDLSRVLISLLTNVAVLVCDDHGGNRSPVMVVQLLFITRIVRYIPENQTYIFSPSVEYMHVLSQLLPLLDHCQFWNT